MDLISYLQKYRTAADGMVLIEKETMNHWNFF
jgi:hypothetical protein